MLNMKQLYLFLFLSFSISAAAQTAFEPGYIIDSTGEKINCFIKNDDWSDNPINFKYKLSEDGDIKTGDINNIKEFSIDNDNKFTSAEVKIDRSSDYINNLSDSSKPDWSVQKVFLHVLLSAKVSLMSYK